MSRYSESKAVIAKVHEAIPADATLAERKKAIFDAYPFGEREYWPYKMWLKAQREYFATLGDPTVAEKQAAELDAWKRELAAAGYSFGEAA